VLAGLVERLGFVGLRTRIVAGIVKAAVRFVVDLRDQLRALEG